LHALVAAGGVLDHFLEAVVVDLRVGERVGEVEDRAVGFLAVNAVEHAGLLARDFVKGHGARLHDRRELGRVAKEQEGGEDFREILHLAVIQH